MKNLVGILFVFILAGAGCSQGDTTKKPEDNSQPVTSSQALIMVNTDVMKAYVDTYGDPEKMPKVIDPTISVQDKKREETFAQDKYIISATYPVIMQLPNSAVAKDLNQHIETLVNGSIAFYQPVAKDWGKIQPPGKNSEISVNYRPYIITQKFISLQFHASLDSFGLYKTWNSRIPFVYDVENGKQIKLEDFFKKNSSYIETVSQLAQAQLREPEAESLFDDRIGTLVAPKKENFQDYVVTKDGLLFFFDIFAAGPAIVGIPWSDLKDVLDETGPVTLIQ